MIDPTEQIRRERIAGIKHPIPEVRKLSKTQYGQVWETQELAADFEVIGFMAPFVAVRRKSDGKKGSLEFQHSPRFYYNFVPHES